ncbi:Zinc finger, FLYWCH-type domain-containing protein [Strongyloides ratti]|uniref:Zinc finger, FLYWCH-type domain-containing protein n=1 Tax=Strongyloides ratti TaxID=34506 RepID=A0A090L5S4_STRRB|nr:Zinc finger, FLYWCH-type domain-containing protein [Strongyloides ratti]CEF62844.1 Zinc finger, FLYWCH-type domain-containing protein [Strongyloides ratti]
MYNFERYDPDKPRMVTSFKGNQKLIFEGYRYNIHHIVPTKGVKTWRCVCAKKLTSARSWCKGRAETWDSDTQGLAKGEHNHDPEHEVAELEYFKSQLIMAAIACPNVPLNDLIAEAQQYMTEGLQFTSKDSLKKSLTIARKSSDNGGFKFRNYKTAGGTGIKNTNNKKEFDTTNDFPTLLNSIIANTPKSDIPSSMATLIHLSMKSDMEKSINSNTSTESEHDSLPEQIISNPMIQLNTLPRFQPDNNPFLTHFNLLRQIALAQQLSSAAASQQQQQQQQQQHHLSTPQQQIFNDNNSIFDLLGTPQTPRKYRRNTENNCKGSSVKIKLPPTPKTIDKNNTIGKISFNSPVLPNITEYINGNNVDLSSNIKKEIKIKEESTDERILKANRLTDIFNRLSSRAAMNIESPPPDQSSPTSSSGENISPEKVTIGTQTVCSAALFNEVEKKEDDNDICITTSACGCKAIKMCCCINSSGNRKRPSDQISC